MTDEIDDRPLKGLIGLLALISAFSSPCLLAYQVYLWLRSGTWVPFPTSKLISHDYFSWLYGWGDWHGLQKALIYITNLILDMPLSAFLLILGGVLLGVADTMPFIERGKPKKGFEQKKAPPPRPPPVDDP